ncbi:MAG TPA: PilZ domain-containing protein [Vicinamibacterales bacterium]|nr:PilZ domain-containing protein [Vicinamibacterales bacterium]
MTSHEMGRPMGQKERRRTPRATVSGRLEACRVPDDQPITVINLGLGGFRIRTTYGFTPGSQHEFRFKMADGESIDVGARVIYCTPQVAIDGTLAYVTGFELAREDHRDNRALVEEVLHDLAFRLSIKAG